MTKASNNNTFSSLILIPEYQWCKFNVISVVCNYSPNLASTAVQLNRNWSYGIYELYIRMIYSDAILYMQPYPDADLT